MFCLGPDPTAQQANILRTVGGPVPGEMVEGRPVRVPVLLLYFWALCSCSRTSKVPT